MNVFRSMRREKSPRTNNAWDEVEDLFCLRVKLPIPYGEIYHPRREENSTPL